MTRAHLALAAIACAALVAHLLFIPYAYSPLSLPAAIERFALIRWHQLGSDQNVALVSRALMFFPLGLLLAAAVAPQPRRRFEWPAWLFAACVGCGWAIAVNFAQVWFPGRTVNLNNVAAEFAGVGAGAFAWSALGAVGLRWWRELAAGGHISLRAALNGYVAVYLAASLTPFDFVTSVIELQEKLGGNLYGWWMAPIGCGPAPCSLKFLSVLLATVPCGWWFAMRRRASGGTVLAAALLAVLVATIIELLHFFMVSGVTQGASVLTRTFGMVMGALSYGWRGRVAGLDLNRFGRPAVLALLAPYLVAITYVGGWYRAQRLGFADGLARMNDIVWVPFFHQYYAPYNATMSSALVHFALYAPVGAMCWLWSRQRGRASAWTAALLAGALALTAETSKVFLEGRVPDYTDVFIAAVAAAVALGVLRFISRTQVAGTTARSVATEHASVSALPTLGGNPVASRTSVGARAVGAILIAVAAWTAADFPIDALALVVGLAAYACLLLRFPTAYLIAIPVLLPFLDLAPLSGRFFWDEFDALLAVTLGARLLMPLPPKHDAVTMPWRTLALLGVSVAASTIVGLLPPDPLDANAFSSYLSSYNGLRVAKGYVWAGALLWLVWRDACAGKGVARRLSVGLACGLASAVIGVLWERLAFVGLLDVATPFRAAGLVSATHVGGAYLEAMLVALAPFALAQAVYAKRMVLRIGWFGVVALGAAAVLMTLSRAAFAAWLAGIAVFVLVSAGRSRRDTHAATQPYRRWVAGATVTCLVGAMIWGAQSTYLRQRLGLSSADLDVRVAHWRNTIDMMRTDPLHLLLGMGLGSFPRGFYLAYGPIEQLPAYRIERESSQGVSHLTLSGGRSMYMDQRIEPQRGGTLRLTGLVRAQPAGTLAAGLCEKSFLNSTTCNWAEVRAATTWQAFEVELKPPPATMHRLFEAPLSLSLHNGAFGTRVEVTRLSLSDGHRELLDNGSFARGLDRWFVSSDVHLAWRSLSTPVQVVFEQGALGALCWLAVAVAVVGGVATRAGDAGHAAAIAAALTGLATIAAFDTLTDAPRIVLMTAFVAVGVSLTFRRRPTAA